MLDVIFWGAAGQAKVLRECIEYNEHRLVACFDNAQELKSPFFDIPLYAGWQGFQSWLDSVYDCHYHFLVAIGGDRGYDRLQIHQKLVNAGLNPFIAIHPSAFVADSALIRQGCQILANASVCVDAEVGKQSIINTAATVDHDTKIGRGVHICPGAHIAGCVEIEDYVMVGTGAVVAPRVRIGQGAQIGAGSVVLRDVPPYTVVVGSPARKIKTLEPHRDVIHEPN